MNKALPAIRARYPAITGKSPPGMADLLAYAEQKRNILANGVAAFKILEGLIFRKKTFQFFPVK
jgi:hypothetical protein